MANSLHEFDIVIVGGGIVGACAAAVLAKTYEKIALINNSEPPVWNPQQEFGLRVSAINLASSTLLNKAGVWDRVNAMRAYPYLSMSVWEQASTAAIQFNASDTTQDKLGTIVENQVLLFALNEQLSDLANVTRFDQVSLENLTTIGEHAVLAELEGGVKLTAKLLIGADGQQSQVRNSMGIALQRHDYDQVGLVCTVKTERDHEHTAWQCFTEFGPLALLPLSEHCCSVVWSVPSERGQMLLNLSDDEFNKQICLAFEHRLGRLTTVSARRSFALLGAQADKYIGDRVALVGDAAHVVHPLAGLGLNLGLEDVQALATALTSSKRPLGSQRVLRQYERARKSENHIMQKSLESIDYLFRSEGSALKLARAVGVNLSDKLPPLKLLFMQRALGIPL